MKDLLKFFENVLRNKGDLYQREKLIIFGIKESFFVTIFSIVMLAFPKCRAILKWITYIGVFSAGIGACDILFNNIYALYDSYKLDKNLEATGQTREDGIIGSLDVSEIKEN